MREASPERSPTSPHTLPTHCPHLSRSFNEATAAIPCWNEYTSSRGQIVTKDCGEKPGGFLATQQAGAPVSGSIIQ